MTPRALPRALLCLACVLAGLFASAAAPSGGVHWAWAGVTLAVAVFLLDPPSVSIHLGRRAREKAIEQERSLASLRERAERLDLKDHALREAERRVRERESLLSERAATLVQRENELAAGWARLRAAERARAGPAPETRVQVAMTPEEWLGVRPGAPLPEVRQAWLALVKAYHPDRVRDLPAWAQEDAERRTKAINEAYETLRR